MTKLNEIKKLDFTFNIQQQKLIEELLTEKYFDGYEGYVDIIKEISLEEGKIKTELKIIYVKNEDEKTENSLRFHIKQGQGYKIVHNR